MFAVPQSNAPYRSAAKPGAEPPKYRLITRSDFDGLVCAVLFAELELIEDILFVHPKDMQDGKIAVTPRDITTNLPYVPGVHVAFDHHLSEAIRNGAHDNHVIHPDAPSAARVVYDYYGGALAFPRVSEALMEAVDKADSAQYKRDEILNPRGWVLLNYLMDARTGLGRFRHFRISNYALMMDLIQHCRNKTIEEILELPDVKERVDVYFQHEALAREQIKRCTTMHGSTAVLDLRDEDPIWAANRFLIYALYPECRVSIHVLWGKDRQNVVLAVGKSILDRTSPANIGELMLKFGGGGHEAAGTCQVPIEDGEKALEKVVAALCRFDP